MLHSYSRTGDFNISRNFENQDRVFSAQNDEYVFIALADGVSECLHGDEGAMTACRAAADMMLNETKRLLGFSEEKLCYLLMEHVLYVLERRYGRENIGEYASTLAFALIGRDKGDALIFNLGDGAVLKLCVERLETELLPRSYGGIPVQTVTRNAYRAAEVKRLRLKAGDALMLFSDGLMKAFSENTEIGAGLRGMDNGSVDGILEKIPSPDDMSYIMYRHL